MWVSLRLRKSALFLLCLLVLARQILPVYRRDTTVLMAQHQQHAPHGPAGMANPISTTLLETLSKPQNVKSIYQRSIPLPNNETQPRSLSSPRRVVTLTFANAEYFQSGLLQNWICSLKRLDITNFVVIAIDPKAAALGRELNMLPNEALHWDPAYWNISGSRSGDLSGQLRTTSETTQIFLEFTWRRGQFVHTLLKEYSDLTVVMSDADTAWGHVPWLVVPLAESAYDACHVFCLNDRDDGNKGLTVEQVKTKKASHPYLTKKQKQTYVHSGFLMLRSAKQVHELYEAWIKAALQFKQKDQPSLMLALQHEDRLPDGLPYGFLPLPENPIDMAAKGPLVKKYIRKHSNPDRFLQFCILDNHHFPTAKALYTNDSYVGSNYVKKYGQDTSQVVVFHPNIKSDKHLKPQLLRDVGRWYWNDQTQTCSTINRAA